MGRFNNALPITSSGSMSAEMRYADLLNCFHFAKKKWKAKEFAAAVNRQEIEHAAESIGVGLDEHIGVVLNAMKAIAPSLGL